MGVHGSAAHGTFDTRYSSYLGGRATYYFPTSGFVDYPIPTPVIIDGQRLEAGKIWIRFRTHDETRIYHILVYDGENNLFDRYVDVKGTEDGQVSFDFPTRVPVNYGLNVILQLAGPHDNYHCIIDIIAVGIGFY